MKTAHTILLDLLPGQATTDAIAEHMTQPRPIIQAFLNDLETDGLVSRHLAGHRKCLTVWRITPAGRDLAASLTEPANA